MRCTTQEKELLLAVRANLVKGLNEAEEDMIVDLFQECLDDLNTVFPREKGDGYLGGFSP